LCACLETLEQVRRHEMFQRVRRAPPSNLVGVGGRNESPPGSAELPPPTMKTCWPSPHSMLRWRPPRIHTGAEETLANVRQAEQRRYSTRWPQTEARATIFVQSARCRSLSGHDAPPPSRFSRISAPKPHRRSRARSARSAQLMPPESRGNSRSSGWRLPPADRETQFRITTVFSPSEAHVKRRPEPGRPGTVIARSYSERKVAEPSASR